MNNSAIILTHVKIYFQRWKFNTQSLLDYKTIRICARHEHREFKMELRNGNGLNSWFKAILWLNIVFSCGGLLMSLIRMMKGGYDLYALGNICAACVAIAGFYWLLKAEIVGFLLLVAGCLLNAMVAYVQYCNISMEEYGFMYSAARTMAFKGMWTSLVKITFFMLLMLLRCDGKNVYQVLWNKE